MAVGAQICKFFQIFCNSFNKASNFKSDCQLIIDLALEALEPSKSSMNRGECPYSKAPHPLASQMEVRVIGHTQINLHSIVMVRSLLELLVFQIKTNIIQDSTTPFFFNNNFFLKTSVSKALQTIDYSLQCIQSSNSHTLCYYMENDSKMLTRYFESKISYDI